VAQTKANNAKPKPIEKQLWKAADKLRKNIDTVEYKHIVLGLIFLKYISDAFENLHARLKSGQGGQFYTPRSVVELLVEMLEPHKGRVFDPCCGSGGMFVQSEKFVANHQGKVNDISIFGQESNQTTWRLATMNLAIRGIDSSQVKWNNEGSFLNDAHKDLKADYVIANPPFNDSDWSGDLLRKDGRWKYGAPPSGNANYAWIQHFLYHTKIYLCAFDFNFYFFYHSRFWNQPPSRSVNKSIRLGCIYFKIFSVIYKSCLGQMTGTKLRTSAPAGCKYF